MLNGRFGLSVCAFLFGMMLMMALIASGMRSPLAVSELAPLHLGLIALFIAVPMAHWLLIFFRRRGSKVIVPSRPHLSISAFLLGEMLVLTFVSLGFVTLPPFESYSTTRMIMFVGLAVALVMIWTFLFFARGKQGSQERRADGTAVS